MMGPGAIALKALILAQLESGHMPNDLECRAQRLKLALVNAAAEEAVALDAPHNGLLMGQNGHACE